MVSIFRSCQGASLSLSLSAMIICSMASPCSAGNRARMSSAVWDVSSRISCKMLVFFRNYDARISSFSLQSANDTKYTTFNNREYASLQLVYYIREGSNLRTSGTKFTLRKGNSGKWKILYWELVDSVDLS